MNSALRDAVSAGFYVLFGLCCLVALPFPLALSIFSIDLEVSPDVGLILMASFVGYVFVGIASTLYLKSFPVLATSGLIVLGAAWFLAFLATESGY